MALWKERSETAMGNLGWDQRGGLVWLWEQGVQESSGDPLGCDLPPSGAAVTVSDDGTVAARVPPDWSDWEGTLTAVPWAWLMFKAFSCSPTCWPWL